MNKFELVSHIFLLTVFVLSSITPQIQAQTQPQSHTQSQTPSLLRLEGVLFATDGITPLNHHVDIRAQIVNPSENCVIYEQKFLDLDLSANGATSAGEFILSIGSAVNSSVRGEADAGKSMGQVFANASSGALSGVVATSAYCPSGYTPSAGDVRRLRLLIHSIDENYDVTLSPSVEFSNVPWALQAENAQTLQGLSSTDFVRSDGSTPLPALATPTNPTDAAPKSYVDNLIESISWGDISGKPATFPPSAHTHNYSELVSTSGVYMDYKPNNSPCVVGQVLKWTASNRWECANASTPNTSSLVLDNGAGSTITLQTPLAFTSYAMKLPISSGINGQILSSNGLGDLIWTNPASLTVTSSDVTGALGYTPVNRAGDTMTGSLTTSGSFKTSLAMELSPSGTGSGQTAEIQFKELAAGGANHVGFKAPDSIATNTIWTLPNTDGGSGQLLTTNGSGILSWVTPSVGSGEANTSSNIGIAGVGIYKQKTGLNFEFKKINAGSSKITVTDDTANNELDVDISTSALEPLLTLGNLGGTLGVAKGGTGITIGTSGGVPYFSGASTMTSSAALTANGVMLGGGAGGAPTATAAGTANQILRVPAGGGAPVFGAIDLSSSAVVGSSILPVANGGTGASSLDGAGIVDKTNTQTITGAKTFSTNIVSPMIVGGTATTSTLTYKTTSGAGDTGADHIFQVGNNGATEAMRILNSGYIGIGITNPSSPLHVYGTVEVSSGSIKANATNSTQILLNHTTSGWGYIGNLSPGVWSLGYTNGGSIAPDHPVFNWTNSGLVGIGTVSPGVALDVNGAIRAGSSASVSTCGPGQANGEGSQRYNYTAHVMEYCNGTTWVTPGSTNSSYGVSLRHNGWPDSNASSVLVVGWSALVDTAGMFDGSSKITIPVAGNYLVAFSLLMINGSGSTVGAQALVYKNGVMQAIGELTTIPTGSNKILRATVILPLDVGDQLQVYSQIDNFLNNITDIVSSGFNTFTVWKMP